MHQARIQKALLGAN